MQARAEIATQHASRYLQQLCKHWSHRFDVTFTPKVGRIPFSDSAGCTLEAEESALALTITAEDEAGIERLERVVFDHLKRFAFREELQEPAWRLA